MRIRIISFLNDPFVAEIANIDINIKMPAEIDTFEMMLTSMRDELLIDLVHNCEEYEKVDFYESEERPEFEESFDMLLHYFAFRDLLVNQALDARRFEEIDSYLVIKNPYMKHLEYS